MHICSSRTLHLNKINVLVTILTLFLYCIIAVFTSSILSLDIRCNTSAPLLPCEALAGQEHQRRCQACHGHKIPVAPCHRSQTSVMFPLARAFVFARVARTCSVYMGDWQQLMERHIRCDAGTRCPRDGGTVTC